MGKQWPSSRDRAATEILPLGLALYHAAREYPGGVKAVAAVHGLNTTTLQHKLSPTHEPHRPNLDDFEAVLSTTLDPRILDTIGEIAGVLWVRPCEQCDDMPEQAMLSALTQLHTKVAKMLDTITEGLADGHLDERELAQLELRTSRLLSAVLGVRQAALSYPHSEEA